MLSKIESFIEKVKDPRRKQGLRHPFNAVLTMIILGVASGFSGYRPLRRFMEIHRSFFEEQFDLKYGIPTFAMLRNLIEALDKQVSVAALNEWMTELDTLKDDDWVAGDGKVLTSTKTDVHNSNQNFVSVVSLYVQSSGLCVYAQDYQLKKSHENEVLLTMLEHLKDRNLTITLDALHFQKKL
jgi:DDE_Tnp_1-associated